MPFTRFWDRADRGRLDGSGLFAQEMDVDDGNSPTTRLLTLLNVSAAKSLKRKYINQQISPTHKPDKRRVLFQISQNSPLSEVNADRTVSAVDSISEQKDDADADAEVNEPTELTDAEGECQYL